MAWHGVDSDLTQETGQRRMCGGSTQRQPQSMLSAGWGRYQLAYHYEPFVLIRFREVPWSTTLGDQIDA